MMRWLDRLNLQPQERRWLLVGIVVLAVVLNYWLVWPYFSEWTEVQQEISRLSGNRTKFIGELSRKFGYELQLKELQLAGAEVLQEDQANRLQATIQSKASEFGVTVGNIRPIASAARTGQTNAFFDEQQMSVEVIAGEVELVNFLHALGLGDSLIRVRDIARLRLDQTQTRLQTTLTVVASYQKKPKTAPATTSASRPTTASRASAATNAAPVPAKK
ncbi:MAG: hypothetical protein KF791_13720 [Verrucomicrobiae bacterium]|nr:hypothetical protein [Verrucomicrobiae bacterium]